MKPLPQPVFLFTVVDDGTVPAALAAGQLGIIPLALPLLCEPFRCYCCLLLLCMHNIAVFYISSIDKPICVTEYFDNSLFSVAVFSASSVGQNLLR